MPAFIVSMMTINDPELYKKYTDRTPAIVKRYGGKFLTRGQEISNLEGQSYEGRLVVLEFPSKADIDAWYNDPEYEEVRALRQAASTMHYLMVQEGSPNREAPDPGV